ncbi:unnamed protein product [Porites evermanni]|uniref:Uncharacterized protein n=1 Tax=Porites evermanni TaxID=104178 RepID=A0ABN8MQI7_9CNID|nr:unnamed protein product [Porites evermanni]
MNPALTLAFAAAKRLPWKKVPVYWTAQVLGAFVASACVYGVYYDALNKFDGGVRQVLGPKGTAGIWATYPQPFLSTGNGFGDQVLGTALFVGCVFAITDKKNNAPDKGVAPFIIGLLVFVIGTTFGFNCGYAINPARDLGPRIFTAMAGWGGEVFTIAVSFVVVVVVIVVGVINVVWVYFYAFGPVRPTTKIAGLARTKNLKIVYKVFVKPETSIKGTLIGHIFAVGSGAQMILSDWRFGNFFSVNLGGGMGVTMGCYWAWGISGAQMNPALTLAFAAAKRLPWKKVPVYWTAQVLGAFVASACVYGVYYDALNKFDGGVRQVLGPKGTAGIWATYPQPFLSTGNGFGDQVLGTALFVGCVFAITDKKNNAPDKGVAPFIIGLLVFVIGTTFGFNCGYAINPARDLGPRIFTAMAGWGGEVFTASNNWFWVPIFACFLGGVLGALIYVFFIEMHHDLEEGEETKPMELESIITSE